ncbi:MAG TPA: AP endonuclease [Pseudomonas sp.]|uniref:sugar phosphate isomerase/epimerase family protein n=1 Tax=Pseudomonas sp. TaxID=306 RepID=UPI002B48FDBF|nr:AP endonuclease [Pseudomonas sp.]HKS12263.1 AP endonuclease [Pseudomonas sp.]
MTLHPVSISLSSYGAELVRARGQAAFVPVLAQAGARLIELREELMADQEHLHLQPGIADHGLDCVYSSTLELWQADQAEPCAHLAIALQRASTCGARWLKVSLGFFHPGCDLHLLAKTLDGQPVRVLVENDQTAQGGKIDALERFLTQARALGVPVGMTFDIGNWQWQAQSALEAAQRLGRFVEYLHCKAVARGASGKLVAVTPSTHDLQAWQSLLAWFPRGLVRAVEYPLQGDDLLSITRAEVLKLAQLDVAEQEVAHG